MLYGFELIFQSIFQFDCHLDCHLAPNLHGNNKSKLRLPSSWGIWMPHSTHENHNQSISNLWLQLAKLRQITNNTDKSPCQNQKPPAVSKTNPEMPTPQNQPLSLFGLSTKNPDLSVRGERELVRPLFRHAARGGSHLPLRSKMAKSWSWNSIGSSVS